MPEKYLQLTPQLYAYLVERGAERDDLLRRVAKETEALGDVAIMQVAPEQGTLLTLLVRLTGARRALEIGTFTGYSAICIARGLPADGELICLERNERYAATASAYFAEAGLADRIEIRLGDALETLAAMPASGTFDFVFIDADKVNYPAYYEAALARLAPGGVMMLDNVLLGGRVLAPEAGDEAARVVRDLNVKIADDDRVDHLILPVADGIALVRKRT